ncbi:MAG: hypothetical protein HKP59_02855 [Lutibacter sp.]|uniref:hypothetical protein n=1 Tax=Lutibacter sp. TaxID=1925666 RepID=UPI001794C216|nr:hypothetical protein [Lutibacter sp.]MBT8316544.1 hypothetical protein [Lutibacter sp.]NNJ57404.1 hypothetical protein [Lutibacter sp.]
MIISKTKNYTLIKPNQKLFSLFYIEFEKHYSDFKDEHLIIDFSETFNIKIEELILFLKLSEERKNNGTSFVLVSEGIDIDLIPDEINVVPTLTEAIDILEMDAIERDLGF